MKNSNLLELLDHRRSTPSLSLKAPGPDPQQLDRLVASALRVPDHGKLAPWRILHVADCERSTIAEWLVQRHAIVDPQVAPAALDKDRQRFGVSPCLLVVISSIQSTERIPEVEQLLSAGCVCFGLLMAAEAMGFGAQWLTGWAAYDGGVAEYFGLNAHERIIGFIHIGSSDAPAPDRERPAISAKLQAFPSP